MRVYVLKLDYKCMTEKRAGDEEVTYVNKAVPQVFISGIAVPEPPKVPNYATLKAFVCQEIPQHMENTCSLKYSVIKHKFD